MTASPPDRPGGLRYRLVGIGLLAVVAGLGLGWLWRGGGAPPGAPALVAGTALPTPKPLKPFALLDQDGRGLTADGLRGHWTFAAIGYTTCPDVCPMTLATFVALRRRLVAAGGVQPQFLFISVDPGRDTPERLAQYVRHFDPSFRGATGTDAALRSLVGDLGGLYARVEDPGSALGYTLDHSATLFLIDPEGRLAAIFGTPHDPAALARDFAALAQGQRPPS